MAHEDALESMESEQATLGAMLIDADVIPIAMELLEPESFYRELHKVIFARIVKLFESGQSTDHVSVTASFSREEVEKIGGFQYLFDLTDSCPSSANIRAYAEKVKEKAELRNLIAAAGKIREMAYSDMLTAEEIKAHAEQLIMNASRDVKSDECEAVGKVSLNVLAGLEFQIRNQGRVIGISTGFEELDNALGGCEPNHLWVLGGRPSMGKSALLLQIAFNIAMAGHPALVFCFEMSKAELTQRLLCLVAEVDSKMFKRGLLDDEEIGRVLWAREQIKDIPLLIQDSCEMTTSAMRNRARRVEAEYGKLGLIGVDYLQIIADAAAKQSGNRAEALGKIARECHIMGGERGCTTLALSQLSRNLENRDNKRPVLADLRESGSIEAEANKVSFVYRDGYYKRREAGGFGDGDTGHIDDSIAEVINAKVRGGDIGTVRLRWTGKHTRFDSLNAIDPVYAETAERSPVWAPSGPWENHS